MGMWGRDAGKARQQDASLSLRGYNREHRSYEKGRQSVWNKLQGDSLPSGEDSGSFSVPIDQGCLPGY